MSLLDHVYGVAWAIRPEALAAICRLAERDDITPEAVAAAMHFSDAFQKQAVARFTGQRLDRTVTASRRGRIAVVPVTGPIVRYADLFSSASGGTSVETLASDFAAALDDPKSDAVLLAVDSPGGEISGVAEMAEMIHRARTIKPVWAYVSDLGASAAYWLASAADQIVLAQTAAVGSIGAVAAVKDPAKSKGEIEFVSSVSPNKRADPTTESGRAQLQQLVDTLGEIFVADVARFRAVDPETVVRRYGAGGLLIGQGAVDAGMAERLGSFEDTLDDLHAHLDGLDAEAAAPEPAADDGPSRRKRGPSMAASLRARFSRFVASLDPPDAAALADALDGIAPQAAAQPPPPIEEKPMAEMPPITVSTSDEGAIPPAIAARLATLEAENLQLHRDKVDQAAQAFAAEQVRAMRATAAQQPTIVALYTLLAEDDDRFGPAIRSDGIRTKRTTLLDQFFAAQPDRSFLAKEMLEAAGGQVIYDRATSPRKTGDEEPDAERVAELLAHTAIGRKVLAEHVLVKGKGE
jgi:ClpP class serine protease